MPAGAVPVQLVPGVPAHSLPPPVFSRESRIPEDSYARMSQWPGVPAAFSSPFPEVPSGCIHMTGPAGKQNLCLLDTTHAWHHSSCQGVMFIRHVPGISWVARCLEAGSMPWVPGKEPRTSQQTQRGAERRGQHRPPWSYGGVTALNTGGGGHGSPGGSTAAMRSPSQSREVESEPWIRSAGQEVSRGRRAAETGEAVRDGGVCSQVLASVGLYGDALSLGTACSGARGLPGQEERQGRRVWFWLFSTFSSWLGLQRPFQGKGWLPRGSGGEGDVFWSHVSRGPAWEGLT